MGSDFELHSFRYRHEGKSWEIDIPATSEADAWQRVCRMQEATYLGRLVMVVPAHLGFAAKAFVWFKTTFRRAKSDHLV
ncbi:MAG: hypothetical protein JSS66_13495 [Armatimonadetes bacterium]|nr:hypothetical protein [Armatimonadota bacterium]